MSASGRRHFTVLSRRSFLLTLAGAAGSGLLAGGCQGFTAAEPSEHAWSAWLLDAYNRESVARLGDAYRAAHPGENSAELLADHIHRALADTGDGSTAAGQAGLAALLQQRVRDDYARDEVVRLSGWIVSVTEARLYALVSLRSSQPDGS